jgi:hypothetical protein
MLPPPAAESLDALETRRAIAILAAMDPGKARRRRGPRHFRHVSARPQHALARRGSASRLARRRPRPGGAARHTVRPPSAACYAQAADLLAVLGSEGAAAKLAAMDAEARASIIESMAPRDAAGALASMEDAARVRPP